MDPDPDPGVPKTCGSGFATLIARGVGGRPQRPGGRPSFSVFPSHLFYTTASGSWLWNPFILASLPGFFWTHLQSDSRYATAGRPPGNGTTPRYFAAGREARNQEDGGELCGVWTEPPSPPGPWLLDTPLHITSTGRDDRLGKRFQ